MLIYCICTQYLVGAPFALISAIVSFFLSKSQHDYKWFLQQFNKQEVN